jgi:adenosylmethionine-8-amino-7-oxononanoate aminotransferase
MSQLKDKDKKYIWHPFNQMKGAEIIPMVKGEGAYVFDEEGNRYIDAFSSWWVNLHGHSHPYLSKALYEQAQKLEHVAFGGFTNEKAVELSERLIHLLPDNFTKLFFSDNGSTSTEVALKMTMQYHHNRGDEKQLFIALENGYHGDTFGSMCVTARGGFNEPFEKHMFDVAYIPAPTNDNIQEVLSGVEELLNVGNVSGFIFEPLVQGAGGMLMHDAEALSQVIGLCQKHGVICIADEVMTAYGRTGKFFACEYLSVQPDIMCISKGVTGGFMPIGITAVAQHIYDAFYSDDAKHTFLHGHSYTGNALACALGVANLEIFEQENTMAQVARIGKTLQSFIPSLESHNGIRAVRHLGAILAIELETEGVSSYFNTKGKEAYQYFLKKGIILRPLGNVLVIIPPYCTSDDDLKYIHQEILNYLDLNS